MGIFDLLRGEDDEARAQREGREARQLESQKRIEAGSIPTEAVERLQRCKARQDTPEHLWTSDLSVSELLLTESTGFEPLGQVMGSSVYHVGIQWRNGGWRNGVWQTGASYEFDVLTQAFAHARRLALSRLYEEAAMLGATAVVGVRLKRDSVGWAGDLLEFSAIGTAVREKDVASSTCRPGAPLPGAFAATAGPPTAPPQAPRLCLSELSGQEFWKLRAGGFRPVGIAVGNCTYYTIPSQSTRNATTGGWFGTGSWQNVELPDYTQATYTARELAMSRMEADARAFGACGIVSVDLDVDAEARHIEVNNQTRLDMLFHFTAIGTAIEPFAGPPARPQVALTLSLRRGASTEEIALDMPEAPAAPASH